MNDLIVVEKLAEWHRLKALVLDSVSSPITPRLQYGAGRIYRMVPVGAAGEGASPDGRGLRAENSLETSTMEFKSRRAK